MSQFSQTPSVCRPQRQSGAGLSWLLCVLLLLCSGAARAQKKDWLLSDLVFDDFEGDTYRGWTLEGNCWGKGPVDVDAYAGQIDGSVGKHLLCTYSKAQRATGKAVSSSFCIPRDFIAFRIGGARLPERCYIQLMVDGKPVRKATGNNSNVLSSLQWNVHDLLGKEAHIEIVDDDTTDKGYLLVDHIVFHNGEQSELSDTLEADAMKKWLRALVAPAQPPTGLVLPEWKMLILFYPHIDTDYITQQGEKRHFTGSLSPNQIALTANALKQLPQRLCNSSHGYARLTVDVKVIDRPVTFADNSRMVNKTDYPPGRQVPDTPDIAPEVALYNKPQRYDSQFVLYFAGPIPQNMGGFGGGGRGGTSGVINYGSESEWKGEAVRLNVFLHEWTHGWDGFFESLGYETEQLHHVFHYFQLWGVTDNNFYPVLHQGIATHRGDFRYGFSPSVWMSGTPLSIPALPPCQLLSPLPEAKLLPSAFTLYWARSIAPGGYEVNICQADKPEKPILTLTTQQTHFRVPEGKLPPGDYLWYVRACKGKERSVIGDRFLLHVVEPSKLEPIKVSVPMLSAFSVPGNGQMVRIRAAASSPAGITSVEAEYLLPSGHKQRIPLVRRSLRESDPVWEGALWMPPNQTGKFTSPVIVEAKDHAERSMHSQAMLLSVEQSSPTLNTISHSGANTKSPWQLPIPMEGPDEEGMATLFVRMDQSVAVNLDGNLWAEITDGKGVTEYAPMLGRGWGEGDDKSDTPRQVAYRFPDSGGPLWKVVYAYRNPLGEVVRSEPQTKVWIPSTQARQTIEAETLASVAKASEGAIEAQPNMRAGLWSEGAQLLWRVNHPGATLTLPITVAEEGTFDLILRLTYAYDYGQFGVSVNGTEVGSTIDRYHPDLGAEAAYIGRVSLKKGNNSLTLKIVGKNDKSPRYFLGVDQIILLPATP